MQFVLRTLPVLALLPAGALAGGPVSDRDPRTLQEAVERAIARAEPGVVCILVSRSEAYAKLHQGPPTDTPGCLGGFNSLQNNLRDDEASRAERALDLRFPDSVPESYGSGLVIDSAGYVLTCAHVVRNAKKVFVRLPGGKGSYADIQALDSRSDLAVLRLLELPARQRGDEGGLKPVTFGDGKPLRKGQFVVGLANPYRAGYRDGSPSASLGIVSNLSRRAPGVVRETDRILQSFHRYGTLIQTDVRLSLGCSGGALLNLDGEVVGITTALAALEGIDAPGGFAVPVDARMRQIIEVLRKGEEVEYGFLGVTMRPESLPGQGAHIHDVIFNGPAQRAGLNRGDILVAINDKPVRGNDDLFLQIGSLTVGSTVRLEVIRGRDEKSLEPVPLAKLYVAEPSLASHRSPALGGLRVDYSSVLSQRSVGPKIPDGVVIREVVSGSAAQRIDLLQVDRLITQVNGTPVNTPAEFNKMMRQSGHTAQLTVETPEHGPVQVSLDLR
jgi:serine protease Do